MKKTRKTPIVSLSEKIAKAEQAKAEQARAKASEEVVREATSTFVREKRRVERKPQAKVLPPAPVDQGNHD